MNDPNAVQSAGAVVIARDLSQKLAVALVETFNGDWAIPKGHREPGESQLDAAFREINEEVGLPADSLLVKSYLGSYLFNEHDKDVIKENHFYLMVLQGDGLPVLTADHEHRRAAWHCWPPERLSFAYPYQLKLLRSLGADPLKQSDTRKADQHT